MPGRRMLTKRRSAALFGLPVGETELPQHYTLADDDIAHVRERRRPRMGFAVQLRGYPNEGPESPTGLGYG